MTQYFQAQLFIAGLQDNIHKELMKSSYKSLQATDKAALDLEIIHKESKAVKPVTVAAFTPKAIFLTHEEQEALNAVWACREATSQLGS
jgi:predicted component of type VI protein secretion system